MNAVSLNAPSQPNPAALPPNLLTQGPTAGGGFIDLISLLLAAPIPELEPALNTPSPFGDVVSSSNVVVSSGDNSLGSIFSKDQSPAGASSLGGTPSATPDQIASALIRFMAKGSRPVKLAITPPTGIAKKSSSLTKTFAPNCLYPASLNSSNAIAITASAVVSVDPQLAQDAASISSESVATAAFLNRLTAPAPLPTRSDPNRPIVSGSNSDLSPNRWSAGQLMTTQTLDQSSPPPFFPNLYTTDDTADASPAAKAPVTFKMQLTPVASQETSDPHTMSGSRALLEPASAPEERAKSEPATTDPVPPPSNAISSTPSSGVASPIAIFPAVPQDSARNSGPDPGNAEGLPSLAPKPVSEAIASAPRNPGLQTNSAKTNNEKTGSEDKPGAEPRPGNQTDTAGDAPEKTPLATVSPAPASPPIPGVPSLHTPVSTPPPLHAGATGSKAMEPPTTPLAASDAKDVLAAPQPSSGQTQQIDVRITPPQAPAVDLQVSQRSGQIQVVVRTPDAGLETALRQDLATLVHSLERSGFQAETFIPNSSESARMNSQPDSRHSYPDSSGNGSFAQSGGRNSGRGSGGNSRGNASRDHRQFEAWTNPQEQQP